jgi:hypothetical protein
MGEGSGRDGDTFQQRDKFRATTLCARVIRDLQGEWNGFSGAAS